MQQDVRRLVAVEALVGVAEQLIERRLLALEHRGHGGQGQTGLLGSMRPDERRTLESILGLNATVSMTRGSVAVEVSKFLLDVL